MSVVPARAAWLALVVIGLGACPRALPPVARPYPAPSAEELYGSLRARAAAVHAIDASARAEQSAPRAPRVKLKVQLYAARPDRLRIELEAPLGAGAATLVTNGERFALFDAREGRFYVGPAEPCNLARLIQVELPPRSAVDALLGSVPLEGAAVEASWDSHDGGRELLTLRADDGSSTRIWLDARDRTWDPVQAEHRDPTGAIDWRLWHGGYTAHGAVRLPRETRVEDPRRKASIKLAYKEQTVDPALPDEGWTLDPPSGFSVEHVRCR